MTIEIDAIVTGESSEPGYYNVLPGVSGIAFPGEVQAVSMLQEELTAGEKVAIIEINGDYGIARKGSNIKGCLSVPSDSTEVIIRAAPASAAAAYIGRLAGNFLSPYSVGTVKGFNGSALSVEYDGKTENLFVAPGLNAADFAVDDLVVVNKWEYSSPLVIGWWSALAPNLPSGAFRFTSAPIDTFTNITLYLRPKFAPFSPQELLRERDDGILTRSVYYSPFGPVPADADVFYLSRPGTGPGVAQWSITKQWRDCFRIFSSIYFWLGWGYHAFAADDTLFIRGKRLQIAVFITNALGSPPYTYDGYLNFSGWQTMKKGQSVTFFIPFNPTVNVDGINWYTKPTTASSGVFVRYI